ncbi:uncharacterized protein N7477_009290 [Penicillium maclennaniae]|uniref:uncharacterized protein n=1 Tax=Penicillium maclennaniae TaxID=1343394 RepID=UPI0025419E54|nr:uncharacterized protein N7477_009290 [Penicillium maclennaniae]KAJ5661674.1 hypothetical protein N7477_009290 [Penicillium maclennaniae]
MAATQKLYPRGTVKRIVKAHSNRSVSKNADILVSPSQPAQALQINGLIAAITDRFSSTTCSLCKSTAHSPAPRDLLPAQALRVRAKPSGGRTIS